MIKRPTNLTLKSGLKKYAKSNKSIFSMPGHKNSFKPLKQALKLQCDVTEVDDTDSLFSSYENDEKGIIGQTEKKLEKFYESGLSIISAGGSTACIQTILATLKCFGERILVNRNCHISVINTCALLDLDIVWIYPKFSDDFGVSGVITCEDVADGINRALKDGETNNGKKLAGVFITSPDYFGNVCSGQEIANICKKNNLLFCVDNAHGAHLKILNKYCKDKGIPQLHPLDYGAHLCCDSSHKTLPALTGSAYLHASKEFCENNFEFNKEFLKNKMSLFCSTSQSYLIMQSIDLCCDYLLGEKAEKDYINLAKNISLIKKRASKNGLKIINEKISKNIDPCRISFFYDNDIFIELCKNEKIECEYKNKNYTILIPTPFNKRKDFKRLINVIDDYGKIIKSNKNDKNNRENDLNISYNYLKKDPPKKIMTIREAMFSQNEIISVDDGKGRIASEIKSFCPPGVAPLIPGEVIDENVIKILKKYSIFHIKVVK